MKVSFLLRLLAIASFVLACAPQNKKSARQARVTPGTKTQKTDVKTAGAPGAQTQPPAVAGRQGPAAAQAAAAAPGDVARAAVGAQSQSQTTPPAAQITTIEVTTAQCRLATENEIRASDSNSNSIRQQELLKQSICEAFQLKSDEIKTEGKIEIKQKVSRDNLVAFKFTDKHAEVTAVPDQIDKLRVKLTFNSAPRNVTDKNDSDGDKIFTTYRLNHNDLDPNQANINISVVIDGRTIDINKAKLVRKENDPALYLQIDPTDLLKVITNISYSLIIEYTI